MKQKIIRSSLFIALSLAVSIANASGPDMQTVSGTMTDFMMILIKIGEIFSYFTATAYSFSSIAKFKKHVDNPQFIPLGVPITESMLALTLFAFPTVASQGGQAIFGEHYIDFEQTQSGFVVQPVDNPDYSQHYNVTSDYPPLL